ncbi:hypothetical protein RN01_30390 [Cupriavidus sp. SHE]|jgi:hypothetical protein|uniref:hypothetical protein n=1 Tax=Cupriavidus TaxID=106589 RepID=UPI00046B6D70|nr:MULTISPECIES: hypothetical protein [Cupriavidus]KWR74518.1 hypothetical protein RN01_30390 [Cupriavidus sp. SHE]
MTTNPDPILEPVRVRQGHAWVDRLADVERWSDEHLAAAHAEIDACPPGALADLVERHRAALWSLLVAHGLLPRHERKPCHPPTTEPDHDHHRPRGLARHLYRKDSDHDDKA